MERSYGFDWNGKTFFKAQRKVFAFGKHIEFIQITWSSQYTMQTPNQQSSSSLANFVDVTKKWALTDKTL